MPRAAASGPPHLTRKEHALLPAEFAETGLIVHRTQTPPKRFQVLGERSCGTNLTKRLLKRNTPMQATELLGWKHGFPAMTAIPADLAVICLVRNAADWALSMHAKPWHVPADMQMLEFSQFIRAPWQTIIDRKRYFEGVEGIKGQPLQQDRDPATGLPFADIFALRRAKLTGILSYLNRDCTCVLLRLETLQAAPEATIAAIYAALDLPLRTDAFRPVHKRLGSKFKPAVARRPSSPAAMNEQDLAFLRYRTDVKQEAALGYSY